MVKQSRTQNSIRNVSYGLIITLLNTLVSFVARTYLVKLLGAEVLGINGLFTEIISVMSLAELGVGMAIIYSLYKPIQQDDFKKISQLMSLYKWAYNIIAGVTFALGIALIPFIDKFITDIYYSINYIRIVFFLFVVKTASTYLFSYKASLLNADQKQYIVSLATVVFKVIFTVISIALISLYQNYIIYLIVLIIQSITTNIYLAYYVDRHYKYVNYNEKMCIEDRKKVFENIKNIFVKRISGVITSSTDNILISALVSTVQVGYYSNYMMIFSVVRTLKQQFTNGIAASIGNLSVTETPKKCVQVLCRLTYMYYVFACIMASGLLAVSKNFITIWLGEEYVMKDIIVIVAILNLYIEICCDPLWQYLEVSGLFKQDKNIGIIGSSINLIVSVILGLKIGIVGIFIGTVCTQVIQLILKIQLIFKNKFRLSAKNYYIMCGKMALGYIVICIFENVIIEKIHLPNIYIEFLVRGSLAAVFGILCSMSFFFKSEEYVYTVQFCIQMVKKIIARLTIKSQD